MAKLPVLPWPDMVLVPLNLNLLGDEVKGWRHLIDIRCCQPIRCPTLTGNVCNRWWHMMCTITFLFPRTGEVALVIIVSKMTLLPPLPLQNQYSSHSKVVSPAIQEFNSLYNLGHRSAAIICIVYPHLQIIPAGPKIPERGPSWHILPIPTPKSIHHICSIFPRPNCLV